MSQSSAYQAVVAGVIAVLCVVSSTAAAEDVVLPKPAPGFENRVIYPPISARLKQQGRVGLSIYVAEDGLVTDAKVAQSSGFPLLDAAALVSAGYWHYEPGFRDGQPVASWCDATADFKLPEQAGAAPPVIIGHALSVAEAQADDVRKPAVDPSFPHQGHYPVMAWWHHDAGTVKLLTLVNTDGWVDDAKVETSSGSPALDAASLVSAGYWHYFPAQKNGIPVPVWWEISMKYVLQGENEGNPTLLANVDSTHAPAIVNFSHPPPGIQSPRSIGSQAASYYPPSAVRNGEEGDVLVLVTVQQDGTVSDPVVVGPCPFHDLNAAAAATVKQWRYHPAQKDGQAIAVRMVVHVFYRLTERG